MEKNNAIKAIVPALAGAALLALVLFLIMGDRQPDGNPNGGTKPSFAVSAEIPENQRTGDSSTENMSKSLFNTGDVNFKEVGGGLKVMDVVEGDGLPCREGATVTCHYAGWLENGTKFDSSYLKGSPPATFSLNQVVKGWMRGLPGMKPGGVRRLIIPSDLGYGPRGTEGIPPNATLYFEVKMIAWQ